MAKWRDWDDTVSCNAHQIFRPTSESEVLDIVRQAITSLTVIRTFGAGHSWSPLVPTNGFLLNLDHLSSPVSINPESGKATLQAGMRLHDAGPLLQQAGLTMPNLGAITSHSIAGAIGSGTHGTGTSFGILGTQMSAVKLIDGNGNIRELNNLQHPHEMSAVRLNLGCLGVIVEVTLDCVPDHTVRVEMIPMDFEEFAIEYRNLYTRNERVRAYWFPGSPRIYVHTMNTTTDPSNPGPVYSWFERVVEWKYLVGALWNLGRFVPPIIPACNRLQEMVQFRNTHKVGRCFDAITTPTPAFHQESEVAVPIEDGAKALREYGELVKRRGFRINVPSEIRFAKADNVLLSPGNGRDTCYIGGYCSTYKRHDTFFNEFCDDLRVRYGARPHWGKLGFPNREIAKLTYPGFNEFEQIRKDFDPNGIFANSYIKALFDV